MSRTGGGEKRDAAINKETWKKGKIYREETDGKIERKKGTLTTEVCEVHEQEEG
jgi:hypothetical protein